MNRLSVVASQSPMNRTLLDELITEPEFPNHTPFILPGMCRVN